MTLDNIRITPPISNEMMKISKKVGLAIHDYDMIHDGDKIMIGVSGGKDSTALLRLLKYRQSFAPIKYDIMAVHVDMGVPGVTMNGLEEFLKKEDVSYHIEKINLEEQSNGEDINCFWCSWSRRKALFRLAEERGFNKIALAHHFDDIVETTLLNLFYQANVSTMTPNQELFNGKLNIIRPLAYVEESDIIALAEKENFKILVDYNCPHNDTSKRKYIKDLLAKLSKDNPALKKNIFNGLKRIKQDYLL